MTSPTAADDRPVDVLDDSRFDAIAELLGLSSKYAAGGALAGESGDIPGLAVRIRQTIRATREAALVMASLGKPEVDP